MFSLAGGLVVREQEITMCAMGGGSSGGALVRPASYLEELCEMGHLNDTLLCGYLVRVRSMQPLTPSQVHKALVHLRR